MATRIKNKTKDAGKRVTEQENKQLGIINYDTDNCYPQRMAATIAASGTAGTCVDVYSRHIGGNGFRDAEFYKAVVNSDGLIVDELLDLIRPDFARFRAFYLHVNVTATGKVSEVFHVPFEHVRRVTQVKKDETGFDFAIYEDWAKEKSKSIKPENINWLHSFKLDAETIAEQVESAGGWELYKGQLLFVSLDGGSAYPAASCDAVLENMLAEIQSDITTTTNIENNFTAKGILAHKGKFEDDKEREQFDENVQEFVGPEGSQILVVDIDSEEEKPEFIPFETNLDDKLFEYTDRKTVAKIIRNYKIPKILLSETEGSGFFNQEQIRDAVEFYNLMTVKERLLIERAFKVVFENFETPVCKSGDFSISPIEIKLKKLPDGVLLLLQDKSLTPEVKQNILIVTFGYDPEDAKKIVPSIAEPSEDKRLLIDIIGVGGTQALQSIIADVSMQPQQKKSALMIIFGLSEADANSLVGLQTV